MFLLKGTAHDVIQTLPRPHQQVEKKQHSRASRPESGQGSGSLRQVLLQMNKSQEEKYKNTIESVCEKINTLRVSKQGTMEDFDTFVYKGDSDSEEELEDAGTILDKSLLKQYTEQLDTFVFRGEGIIDSDSDYSTGGSVKNSKGSKVNAEEDEDDTTSRTLLKQYSETLEEDDDDGDVLEEVAGTVKNSSYYENNRQIEEDDSGKGQSDSPQTSDAFEETFISKYQYKGLKDTFAMRPDKRWSKHQTDSRDLFCPRVGEDKGAKKIVKKSESDTIKKSPMKAKGVSLSASMSSSDSISASRQKVSDPRLNRTLSLENKTSKPKPRMKTCDRIEQSAKTNVVKQKPKTAFVEIDPVLSDDYVDEPDLNVKGVISHLRENITPYTSVDSHSETLRSPSSDDVFGSRVNQISLCLCKLVCKKVM